MRRVLPVLSVLVAALAMPVAVSADPGDKVSGSGESFGEYFQVSARSDPQGEDPRGFFRVTGWGDLKLEVSCLLVIGNLAVIGSPHPQAPDTYTLVLVIRDNGVDNDGTILWDNDQLNFQAVPMTDDAACVQGAALFGSWGYPVVDGDFTVRDALPG